MTARCLLAVLCAMCTSRDGQAWGLASAETPHCSAYGRSWCHCLPGSCLDARATSACMRVVTCATMCRCVSAAVLGPEGLSASDTAGSCYTMVGATQIPKLLVAAG